MAGVSTEQGENRLNTELNLVPFIDLLSTLVLFLLVTAVWLQVAVIQTAVKSKGSASSAAPEQSRLELHLTSAGYRLTWPATAARAKLPQVISRNSSGYDTVRLISTLQTAMHALNLSGASVSADDNVDYGFVIEAIDSAKTSGLAQVALGAN
jgi:biopolymer transport protein TolR